MFGACFLFIYVFMIIGKYKGKIAETVEVERTKLVQEGAAAIVFGLPLKHIAHAFGSFRLKALMFISYFHFLPPFLLLSLIALIAFK